MSKLNLGKDLYIAGRIGWRGLSKSEYLKKSKYRIINATSLMDGYIDWENCGYITKERYDESSEIQLKENDILISKDGTLGKIGYVKNIPGPCSVASGIFVIRNTIPNMLDFDYLYHILKSNIFKEFIIRNKATGSTINHLYQRDLVNFEIELPSYEVQKKIAGILNSIDKKITINSTISSQLESLAKTIYDYWFLQFDFPDENGNPYRSSGGKMVWNDELKREIPEGWEVVNLFDCADVLYGYPLRTEMFNAKQNGLPVVRIRDILNNSISAYTSESVPNKYLTVCGDLLIGMDGNFQMNYWSNNGDCINQRIVRIREKNIPVMIIKMQIEPFINAKVHNVARSTVAHLSDKDLKSLKILIPDNKLDISLFKTFIKEIVNLKADSKICSSLRDFLLPLLMNGQVTIE